jgi:probable rRNA maturation factor
LEKIIISNFQRNCPIPLKTSYIKSLINRVFKKENRKVSQIHVNFVSRRGLRSVNKRFLMHDYNTDVITFDYAGNGRAVDGELLVSLDDVRRNSKFFGTSFKQELDRVVIHGCLHLAGYDDRTKRQKELMRKKENSYLGR